MTNIKILTVFNIIALFFSACNNSNNEAPAPIPDPDPLLVTADFTADQTSIQTGESITFTSTNNENVSNWAWTFDNGNGTNLSSTEQNPTMTFNEAGTYEVSLTVTSSDNNTDTETKADFIIAVKPQKAISFDGSNDYIDIPNPVSVDGSSELSLGAWVKTTDDNARIISNHPSGVNYLIKITPNGQFQLTIRTNDNSQLTTASTAMVNDGNWHYLVGTFDGSSVKLYIDGTLDKTNNLVATTTLSEFLPYPVKIGSWRGTSEFLNGSIALPSIWNKALTASEITNLYNSCELMGNETGLIGYWDFNTINSTITDLTSNAKNGSFQSGSTAVAPTLASDMPTSCD